MKAKSAKVLVVDDDENICEEINMYLKSAGYETKKCGNGKDACIAFEEFKPKLVLLDIMLPGMDGIEVLKSIRRNSEIPIIMITAKGDTFHKVLALELGADDYVVKPFEPKELLARVKAVIRRYNCERVDNELIKFNDLEIDLSSYNVVYKDQAVKMPPKEFELLHYLSINKNKVFTREQLLSEVWGYDYPGDSRTVDVHIKRLREKLSGGQNWEIKTVWGIGYKFQAE
ncbi:response regulator transcription factor [Clostridium gasigenes]|uniref:response regulator transcription factor n=1 Tax=Clostridium gasigenes TaxID=94869 RepID=UPI001C0B59CB|nr:response regulator transcription factor [Clostridium gasigenes]MBU3105775.1 response regulator transcription factor [Clostridium gasigenes]